MGMVAERRLVAMEVEEGVGCTVTEDATAAAAAAAGMVMGSSFPRLRRTRQDGIHAMPWHIGRLCGTRSKLSGWHGDNRRVHTATTRTAPDSPWCILSHVRTHDFLQRRKLGPLPDVDHIEGGGSERTG